METTFPAKLELTSLEVGGRLNDDINCAINLTKGLQNFGEIKFKIKSQDTNFHFHEQKIINFSYTIRLTTRKDFFFHINLFDSNLNEQIGDFIGISCHMLAETFQNDSTTVIQKSEEFAEGVILKYKIYQPQVEIKELNTISFKNIQKNDFISNIFAGPDQESNNLLVSQLKRSRAEKSGHFNKKNPSNLKSSQANMKKSKNQEQGQNQLRKSKKQQLKKSVGKKQPSNQFFSFIFKKQSGFVEKKKKYQFYEKQNHHSHGLSKKLKTVIILLILGAVFLLVDSIADKFGTQQKKKVKKKSIKKQKIEHF